MSERLRITRRAADRIDAGHLWVYRTDLDGSAASAAATASSTSARALPKGSLVTVEDSRGKPLGTAIYSSASKIVARMVSRVPDLTRAAYLSDVGARIEAALALRRELAPVDKSNNAHRLLFSEADNLPGILADRYNDLVLVQLLTQGTAQDDVRRVVAETLRESLSPNNEPLTIWERPDPRIRELEELDAPPAGPLFTTFDSVAPEGLSFRTKKEEAVARKKYAPVKTSFTLNGLRFAYDAGAGQKTGAFLDQRLNYAAAAAHVAASKRQSNALDVCTYQGGFALHLARVCERVTGVDASRAALEVADENLLLNPKLTAEVDWIEADAFDLLRAYDAQQERFDAIVLDPPAFAKSKRATEGALRGYKELNLRAMRMLTPGGTLITNSCSHHVSLEEFLGVVTAAAEDAGRRVQLLEVRGAAVDHPEVLGMAETRYLKCLICRVG
jgi:23S rRNA (cytosine1962-C5)-methyltransferase